MRNAEMRKSEKAWAASLDTKDILDLVEITEDMIEQARGSRGGWSGVQLMLLGIPDPPWKKGHKAVEARVFSLVKHRTKIPRKRAERFVSLRDAHLKPAE